MRQFEFIGKSQKGFQRHHLIPVNLLQRRAFVPLFILVSGAGFDARNFLSNGALLPATERMAENTNLPLHRGPHPHYDKLVAECLDEILAQNVPGHITSPISAFRRISELQGMLRRALRHDASLMLNRNDPRGSVCPLFKLDYDILQLSVQQWLA